jgi:hypothetical protein
MREGGRPHGAFVEVRLVAEAERRVPQVELLRALEEAEDLAVLGIGWHPVPGFRREGWRACLDDLMEPLAHGAIRFGHLGDLCEHYVDIREFGKGQVRRISLPRTPVPSLLFALLLHNRYYWQLSDGSRPPLLR